MRKHGCARALFLITALPLPGAVNVSLTPSASSPQLIGTRILWTALASDANPGQLQFRFEVRAPAETFHIIRDYYHSGGFAWTPLDREGDFDIRVTARNRATGETNTATTTMTVASRVTGGAPVVTPVSHPLVRLYSAPPCAAGSHMRIRFRTGAAPVQYSPWKPCRAGISMNLLVAGLRPNSPYVVSHEIAQSGSISPGPDVSFGTAALPAGLPFPATSMIDPPDATSCVGESIVFQSNVAFTPGQTSMPVATDLAGRILWYYPDFAAQDQKGVAIFRPLRGGAMVMAVNDPATPLVQQQILREIDLAGNAIRETNVDRVSEQLTAMGRSPITSFHHEIIRLPNGNLMALASTERLLTDVQGPGMVDIVSDALVELNQDLQVVWAWDAFDHLDVTRKATLNETCTSGQAGCPPVTKASVANDWLHSNSIHYTPADGNLILSVRHQDWVIKIEYLNGAGTGKLIWRLGKDGDFQISSSDPYPWFSHQHDAEFDIPGVPLLTLFDNGNVRKAQFPGANSRGQVFWMDEPGRRVTPLINADLQSYSLALGAAERVCNGAYHFTSGVITPDIKTQSVEVSAGGQITYILETRNAVYRSFRMVSMYGP
jgi:arylsulfate sulfotransferase